MVKLLLDKGAKLENKIVMKTEDSKTFKYLLKRGVNPKATDDDGDTLLHKQCENGNWKHVKYLIEQHNADVSAKNRKGQTPLHLACKGIDFGLSKRNDLKLVQFLIEEKKADPAVTCNEGKTALHYAAGNKNDLRILRYLIEDCKVNPTVCCKNGKTALHYASKMYFSPSLIRYLIEDQKLDIEATDYKGRTALHIACQSDDLFKLRWETQKYLIEEHAKITEAKDKKGKTALHYCLERFVKKEKYKFDNFRPIALILATKANILKKQENKGTDHVFDWIKQSYDNDMKKSKGEDEAVSCLYSGIQKFQKKLEKKDKTLMEYNPFLYIVDYCNRVDIAEYMFNQDLYYIKTHFNAEEANSRRTLLLYSYLEFSCENGLLILTRFLFQEINNKQKSFQNFTFDGSYLRTACWEKHIEIFKYLMEDEKAKDEAAKFLPDSLLHCACKNGPLEMVQYLIETKQIDVEVKNKEEFKHLHLACFTGSLKIVKYLIEKQNANIDTKDYKGRTPLHLACFSGSFDIAKYLIEKQNASINTTDDTGRTPLHLACSKGSTITAKYLIEKQNANVNITDNKGRSVWHFACKSDCLELVNYISQKTKQDVNAQDEDGSTALHVACKGRNLKVVKFVITDMKANLHSVDNERRTPLHIVWRLAFSKYLVSKGANVLAKDKNGKIPLQVTNDYDKEHIHFLKAATKR